jgi:hypothetical protein
MVEKFRKIKTHSVEEGMTIKGLKREVYTTVVRYFAPLVAILGELEKTAGMPAAWQRRKLDDDHAGNHE